MPGSTAFRLLPYLTSNFAGLVYRNFLRPFLTVLRRLKRRTKKSLLISSMRGNLKRSVEARASSFIGDSKKNLHTMLAHTVTLWLCKQEGGDGAEVVLYTVLNTLRTEF